MLSRLNFRRIIPSTLQVLKSAGSSNIKECFRKHIPRVAPSSYMKAYSMRPYSVQTKPEELLTVDYDYVKKATTSPSTIIIDVREPDEITEHGKIPNSLNIPLSHVADVLGGMPEHEFSKMYQRPKPSADTEIIFYCMIGKRSGKAQQNAVNLGFKNAKNYTGSWTDWASKSQ